MSRLQFREIRLENYRCFDELTLPLEADTTILFAENGGGKTALLNALAMGLAVFQGGWSDLFKLNERRDSKMRTLAGQDGREPVGRYELTWTAAVGEVESVTWSTAVIPDTGLGRVINRHRPILDALWSKFGCPGNAGRCSGGTALIA